MPYSRPSRAGRSADAFVLRLGDGSFELDPSAPLLPEQPAAIEALAAEFSSPAVAVQREAGGRWVCMPPMRDLSLECWDPAPKLPRPRCEHLCGGGRRLELRPCPPLGGPSSALVALAAAVLLSRIPPGEPLDLISRWPGRAAARDWLSLQLLLRCRPGLCMLRREERPHYVHSSPYAALREAIPEMRPWLERLPFEDFRDAIAEHHHLRVVALREGIALAEFDWDPQADDQRSFSLLGESAAAPRSYVLVMSARLPPPGAPPRLAILWGATCGARFGALQPEMPLEPGHMTFSVGRARVIVRWQARAAAEAVVPALPPRVPSAAPSLSFGLAADEEVKLSASLARDGSLAVGAYRTTVRKVRDQLLNAEGELDEGMANALFCCLEARPAHAVLDQDTLALVRERGSQAVVGRLHHAAASAPSIFHLPIHADGRWAYAAASPDGCACLFSTPDSAERIGQTMVSCFEALAAVRWRSLTKPFDPRSDSALQSLLAHALTMRCDSAASLEAVDLSTVDAHSARRWLASRLVESAQFVAEGPARQTATAPPLSVSAPPPESDPRGDGDGMLGGSEEQASSADEAGRVLRQAISTVPAKPPASLVSSSLPLQHPPARSFARSLLLTAVPREGGAAAEQSERDPAASLIVEVLGSDSESSPDAPPADGAKLGRGPDHRCLLPEDLARLEKPDGWLNDAVINAYIELLKERHSDCHYFRTHFYRQARQEGRRLLVRCREDVDKGGGRVRTPHALLRPPPPDALGPGRVRSARRERGLVRQPRRPPGRRLRGQPQALPGGRMEGEEGRPARARVCRLADKSPRRRAAPDQRVRLRRVLLPVCRVPLSRRR